MRNQCGFSMLVTGFIFYNKNSIKLPALLRPPQGVVKDSWSLNSGSDLVSIKQIKYD